MARSDPEKLARALRENLKRRKTAAQALRPEKPGAPPAEKPPTPPPKRQD